MNNNEKNTNSESDKSLSNNKNKKRGPKKKQIQMKHKISLQLNDSDIESSPEYNYFDSIDNNINQKDDNKQSMNKPWIEKYRPIDIDELVLDNGTLSKIKKIIEDKNMPNIIITGSPGIGKTTTILCIAKKLLGKYYRQGVLELNASDDRGVKTVQESIEYFCKKKLETSDKYAKHKIVLLDEADNMTKKAQQSINNLMQEYNNTRFAFTCNNSSQIIEAIQSRCIIFRYCRLSNDQLKLRLEHICKMENIPYSEEGLNIIITTSQGDLRQAINNLQLTFNGYINITPDNVYKLCDKPHPLVIQNIFEACHKKDFKVALNHLNSLYKKGYSSSDIAFTMMYTLKTINNKIIDEKTKISFLEEIGKTSLIISQGMNTPLQLSGTIAFLCK
ncbi:replication factor C small subunit [Indivirus ILV1]|uniref:Replication factor C small subunit n=1 Tax=Indivirus ILV1 TaxID=1977633 RepID=A0A1V0SEG8_9VIRU|nr:replication factor C small subunit [Indivirus ILV1]